MTKRTRRLQASSAGLLAAGLAVFASAGQVPQLASIDPPAAPGASQPAIASEGATTSNKEHEILMAWLEPEPGARGGRFLFARHSGQTWSPPVTIAEHVSAPDPADAPALTVIETRGVRRTLLARAGEVVARSGDGGRTWTRLPAPRLPFASFAGGEEGAYAFWLAAGGAGAAQLLGARVLAGGTLLDPLVADASETSAAMTWDGPVVVYRDRSSEGAPEVCIVRRQDARWTAPRPILAEGSGAARSLKGGPMVAALRRQVAVAWVTQTPRPRLQLAFSADAGRTFAAPVELAGAVGEGEPSGSVALTLGDEGHALVLWTAGGPAGATLNLARLSPDGRRGDELVLAREPSAQIGQPRITLAGDRVAVTWIEGGSGGLSGRVRALAVPLAAVPEPGSRRAGSAGPVSAAYSGRGRVGDPVPDLELVSLAGEKVSLSSLRGRAVLLNLWATWCLPCIAEMPELAALQERHGAKGLVVVGLNVDAEAAAGKVRAFVAERKLPFPVWLDPGMRVPAALRVQGLPASFVIDREGRIVLRRDHMIEAADRELANALGSALGDPRSGSPAASVQCPVDDLLGARPAAGADGPLSGGRPGCL